MAYAKVTYSFIDPYDPNGVETTTDYVRASHLKAYHREMHTQLMGTYRTKKIVRTNKKPDPPMEREYASKGWFVTLKNRDYHENRMEQLETTEVLWDHIWNRNGENNFTNVLKNLIDRLQGGQDLTPRQVVMVNDTVKRNKLDCGEIEYYEGIEPEGQSDHEQDTEEPEDNMVNEEPNKKPEQKKRKGLNVSTLPVEEYFKYMLAKSKASQ